MAFERQDISIIGSNISKFRKLKKYTQKQLGDLLDVNPKTVSKWENGTVGPDITILKSLADALDVSVEELLSGIKNKNKKYKRSVLLNIIFSFVIVILISCITYMYVNRYEVYEFKSDHEHFNIDGYIVSGRGQSRFVFEDFSYVEKSRKSTMINDISIMFYNEDDLLFSLDNSFEEFVSLDFAMDYLFESEMLNSIFESGFYEDNILLKIKYYDSHNEIKTENIELKMIISKNEN